MASAIAHDLAITKIFNTTWNSRDGRVVPETDDVNLADGAVRLGAVLLYADLFHSTELARRFPNGVAAKVVRAYLSSMARLVKANGGEVRSFDGDRVMGVFVGDRKNTSAAECALRMSWVVTRILRPKAEAKFPSLRRQGFRIDHCAGLASSDVLVVRGGVRGSNDLVFVGSAPNVAAKLSDIRNATYDSYITTSVYSRLRDSAKYNRNGGNMWEPTAFRLGTKRAACYRSSWMVPP